eukprot:m51a1_g3683 hypothetical protein (72) ;mRNA; r:322607-322964
MMHSDWAARNGDRVCVLGDVTLLPAELSATVETELTLNVCLAYISCDVITHAVRVVAMALQDGRLLPEAAQ